jgi:type VI secretion system protein ImpF
MPELTAFEKLQPCLLDRLTDEDPKNAEESRTQRVVSLARYKRGVLRDIEWLLNASAHSPEDRSAGPVLADFPEARQSVLNFGTRHLCGLIAPDMERLEAELVDALRLFEPRILRHSLAVKAKMVRQVIGIEIRGELWAAPIPEQLFIRTRIDTETGQSLLGDAAHG